MNNEKFRKKKLRLFKEIESINSLNEDIEEKIIDLYGSRGKKAINTIKEDRIKFENGKWIVDGNERDYEVVKSYCCCYDYVLNVVTGKTNVDMCYHSLAKRIKEKMQEEK